MATAPSLPLPRRTLNTTNTEANWGKFRHGEEAKRPRGRIVVELPPKPVYVPKSGPPLEPVRIVPPRDSTAYIIERILLPPDGVSLKDNKPLPKRMTYIIAWRDLPAARLLIPAMKILDYVSPRELEDWELRLEEELDEQRAQLEEEQRQQEKLGGNINPVTGKRKRGRPPAHTQIEPGAVAELETEEDAAARLKGGALSLSTPQKSRLKEFEGLLGEDASPSRQIEKELYDYDMGGTRYEGGEEEEEEAINEIESESEMDVDEAGLGAEELPFDGGTNPQTIAGELSDWTSNDPLASNGTSSKHSPAPESQSATRATPWAAFGFLKSPGANGTAHRASSPASTPTLTGPPSTKKKPAAGKSKLKPAPAAAAPVVENKPKPAKKKAKSSDKGKGKKREETGGRVDENGDPVWVVERIEDYDIFEVEGQTELKKYFQVRWEGDWPPDQNPSWEPEENLPANLVRNYFKNGKRKGKGKRQWHDTTKSPSTAPKKKMKQTTLPWTDGRQYSSVSEAFAGGDEADVDTMQGGNDPFDPTPDDDDHDEFFSPEEGNEKEEFFIVDDDADEMLQPQLDWNRVTSEILGHREFGE